MKILEQLFDSRARVRLMRLFLLNPRDAFETKDLTARTKEQSRTVQKEINLLGKIGFIKKVSFFKESAQKTKSGPPVRSRTQTGKTKKKRVSGWQLDTSFSYLEPIQHLIITSASMKNEDIIRRIKKTGNVKLIVLSGIFIREDDTAVDILVVGDNIKKQSIENALGIIEAELGKELTYAFLETRDFKYRMGMYDKFIRDVFDYPHEKIVDKLGLSDQK